MKRILGKLALLLLLPAAIALASFAPHQQIDHENKPTNGCHHAAVTLVPGSWSHQPVYVAMEDDSTEGIVHIRSDVMFQKSDDGGRTWLPADVLVRRGRRFATFPDIATGPDGSIYIVYKDDSTARHRFSCQRSSDGGATWSEPSIVVEYAGNVFVGGGRIAADSGGNLFCAWNGGPMDDSHIYASVSSDGGATWATPVRVDDDTTWWGDCLHADVFVQPGTNHYLVTAKVPNTGGGMTSGAYFYRSTDMGRTFQSGVRLDTFGLVSQPHVVADAQHIVCDYTGGTTEARTLYTEPDTWGSPSLVSRLDSTQFWSYYNGAKLAISADGSVHTALMVCVDTSEAIYLPYYASSSDHGVTWSSPELVNDDPTANSWNPDIAADSAGHAYVVWQAGSGEVWFSTNNPLAIAEETSNAELRAPNSGPTVVRGVLFLPERASSSPSTSCLLDISGRQVMDLKPGANDVSLLSPGVYFLRGPETENGRPAAAVTKVVIAK